jgi:hypothetical protein
LVWTIVLDVAKGQGTQKRTQQQLELEIENMGAHLNAYTSVSISSLKNGSDREA